MNKKMIVPIITGTLICLYFLVMIFDIISFKFFNIGTILGLIAIVSLMILTIYLVKERIDEIKGGEEDDISKY